MTDATRVEDAQKLRSAVAHELNNVLTVVRTYTHFARQPTTPLVVLVVDDEQVIRDSFQRLLAECDFDTLVANSGLHALHVLEERRVDAIVADQFMPGLGGLDLLELVYERFPECIRILCTGHASSDLVISAINRGRVQRVLPKNMHAVALRDEIERVILEGMQKK